MIKSKNAKMVSRFTRAFGKVLEHLTTFMYHEQFKRMTLDPMREIIQHEQEPELQQRMLRQWARTKIREASYIQLAGGFLFTNVASCLQWESVQNGHWSARACFYACMLLAFVAIVMGSQQMLLLPSDRPPQETSDDSEGTEATESKNRYERELKLKEE
ncbi:MAG: hypothetical protein L6R36_007886 [Xanthoria steineri]|nr:MAG: hypothetical protein L6R36_007886 [Xanthoria steineri]